MSRHKYSDEQFSEFVAKSNSIASVIRCMHMKVAGGNYATVQNRIKKLSLDTSHFTGQGWTKGKVFGPKRPTEEYLQSNTQVNSNFLRRRLLKESRFIHMCNMCKQTEWLNHPIPLELHHKDGDRLNNVISNLELLCPNCHSFTDNYRGRNKPKSSLGVTIA